MNDAAGAGRRGQLGAAGRIYIGFEALAARLESPFLLLVRLYFGWQFLQTGWGKLHTLPHVIQFFTTLSIPAPGIAAPCVATLEFVGGLLLILGLGTRLVGLLLTGNMLVAYITADREGLASLFSADATKFFSADPFPFLAAALIAFVFGAGAFSLDYLLARRTRV
ncbi:MAG TPA: DoxX family protein [Acidisarcina sp.]